MQKSSSPLVLDSFQLSLTSGPLQATEASLNAAREHAAKLPPIPESAEVREWIEACWRNCMLLFSAGQEKGRGSISRALDEAADINEEHARLAIQRAVQLTTAIAKADKSAEDAAAQVERFLLQCGELISTLFAAGRIDGEQGKNGLTAPLPKPGQHKTC